MRVLVRVAVAALGPWTALAVLLAAETAKRWP